LIEYPRLTPMPLFDPAHRAFNGQVSPDAQGGCRRSFLARVEDPFGVVIKESPRRAVGC
jgi:hypothetical protein